jgi:hypothetical protein
MPELCNMLQPGRVEQRVKSNSRSALKLTADSVTLSMVTRFEIEMRIG